jgi:uncharacterized phage infection (PIP) family protein YhgE
MDDTFELLTKMYADITKRLDVIEIGQQELRSDINELKTGQGKIEIKLEHDINNSLQSLHDGVNGNTSTLKEHTERLNAIENKVDYITMSTTSQDKRLKIVESSKKKAK